MLAYEQLKTKIPVYPQDSQPLLQAEFDTDQVFNDLFNLFAEVEQGNEMVNWEDFVAVAYLRLIDHGWGEFFFMWNQLVQYSPNSHIEFLGNVMERFEGFVSEGRLTNVGGQLLLNSDYALMKSLTTYLDWQTPLEMLEYNLFKTERPAMENTLFYHMGIQQYDLRLCFSTGHHYLGSVMELPFCRGWRFLSAHPDLIQSFEQDTAIVKVTSRIYDMVRNNVFAQKFGEVK